jgi:hypothetical protein
MRLLLVLPEPTAAGLAALDTLYRAMDIVRLRMRADRAADAGAAARRPRNRVHTKSATRVGISTRELAALIARTVRGLASR